MSASTGWVSALIAAAVSLIVFALTQLWTTRREQRTQAYQRRRSALMEVQDAALALRSALGAFGPLARTASGRAVRGDLANAQHNVERMNARLGVALTSRSGRG